MNAANADELAAFASQNAGTALAGVALLENADDAYKAGKYAEARELYSSAVKELEKTVLEGRASLGAAVSAYASGDTQAGMDALKAVSIPTVEVHISAVDQREDFRKVSYVCLAAIATIAGKGFSGYLEAMDVLKERAE